MTALSSRASHHGYTTMRDSTATLIEEGHRSIAPEAAERRSNRLAALGRVSGSYTGVYEPGHLDDLRAEWPE